MKSSQILRRAARRVEGELDSCGCRAIANVMGEGRAWDEARWNPPPRVLAHFAQVAPRHRDPDKTWWGGNRNARIIGLCLAAAIAEDEGQ